MHDILTVPSKFLEQYSISKDYYEARTLPSEFGSPNVILIFGNRLVNIFWGEPLFAFVIENDEIAKNYVSYFNYLWKTLPAQKKP